MNTQVPNLVCDIAPNHSYSCVVMDDFLAGHGTLLYSSFCTVDQGTVLYSTLEAAHLLAVQYREHTSARLATEG